MPESSTDSPKSKVRFGFNAKSREAQAVAKRYAAEQVDRITKETKNALKRVISESIRDGIPPREAAKQIRESVGLNRPQALALKRYVRKLSPTLSTAAKEKAEIKLKNKMIRRRAITIARTEVIDSLTGGVELAWGQAQKQGLLGNNAKKEWMTTPFGACNICQALDGDQVLLNKKFISKTLGALDRPTAHPNCRCGIAPVPGMGGAVAPPPAVQATGAPASTMARMAVSADGDLLKGADARKALLKYADDPDSAYNVKLKELEKKTDDLWKLQQKESQALVAEGKKWDELYAQWQREYGMDAVGRDLFFSKDWSKINKVIDKVTGKSYNKNQILFQSKRQTGKWKKFSAKWQKGKGGLSKVSNELSAYRATAVDDVLDRFVYNSNPNKNVDIDLWVNDEGKVREIVKFKKGQMVSWRDALTEAEMKSFNGTVNRWRRLVDDDLFSYRLEEAYDKSGKLVGLQRVPRDIKYKIRASGVESRASARAASLDDGTINVDLWDLSRRRQTSIVHELTHHVEFNNPDLLAESIRWRESLTLGEKAKFLKKVTGNKNYKPWEIAYEDDFERLYTGKVYNEKMARKYAKAKKQEFTRDMMGPVRVNGKDGLQDATEVLTMGVQEMFANPVALARDQPKLFDFIYERVVKRKFTHDSSSYSVKIENMKVLKKTTSKLGGKRRGSLYKDKPVDMYDFDWKEGAPKVSTSDIKEQIKNSTPWPISDKVPRDMGEKYQKQVFKHYEDYASKLSVKEMEALETYTGSYYNMINSKLRKNPNQLTDEAVHIQKAIDNAPKPPPPELVWRGVNEKALQGKIDGEVLQLDGFQSSSIDPSTAKKFFHRKGSENIVLEIRPTKGLYTQPVAQSRGFSMGESEFLLPHKTKVRIVGRKEVEFRTSGGVHERKQLVVQVEMVD